MAEVVLDPEEEDEWAGEVAMNAEAGLEIKEPLIPCRKELDQKL